MATKRFTVLLIAAVIVTGAAVAVLFAMSALTGPGDTRSPLATGAMSGFQVHVPPRTVPQGITFNRADGVPISLEGFRGRIILVNLWASWCAPCLTELPTLDALQQDLGSSDFEVLAVNIDRKSRLDKAKTLYTDLKIKALAFYNDPTANLNFKLNATGLPTTILIGRDGQELGRLIGDADWDSAEARVLVQHYVGPNSTAE